MSWIEQSTHLLGMESKLLKNIRRIAIVGGGPTGIATAKYVIGLFPATTFQAQGKG